MSDTPLAIQNNELTTLQSNTVRYATEPDSNNSTTVTDNDGDWTQDSNLLKGFERLRQSGEFAEYDVVFDYSIDADDIGVGFRRDAGGTNELVGFDVGINGNAQFREVDGAGVPLQWEQLSNFGSNNLTGSFDPGEQLTLRFEWVSGDNLQLDLVSVYDTRFSYDFANNLDANDQLPGPELYPDLVETTFNSANTRRDVTSATVSSTWDDTSNEQYIEVSIGGDSNRNDNSDTVSHSVSSGNAAQTVTTSVGLSRYGSRNDPTPTTGFNGQSIEDYMLTANVDAITPEGIGVTQTSAIIPRGTLNNVEIKEGGQLDTNDDLLTRAIFPGVDFSGSNSDQIRLQSSERTEFTND